MPRVRTLLAGTAAGLVAAAGVAVPASAQLPSPEVTLPPIPAIPGLPIPSLPTDLLVPRFIGAPATEQPIDHPPIPQNPWLSPDGTNSMHNDAYASDAYQVSGPLGRNLKVKSASYGIRECATIAFDSHGRIVGLCGGLEGFTMMVIDPVTLKPISEMRTSARNLLTSANPFTDICGGTYFFLDGDDVAYPTTGQKKVLKIKVQPDGKLLKQHEWSLAAHIPAKDCLIATMPDWDGRIWFFTQQGRVGTIDRDTGAVQVTRLPDGEEVTNSVATDETGGMYVVSTHALYRLDATTEGVPEVTWREVYDRGTRLKPGNLSQGSGTTPTLLGDQWVAINDNADPQTNVLVYDRREGATDRLHCTQPVLADNAGTTDNSLVAVGNSFIIENNYGYKGPLSTILGKTTTPGLARVMVEDDGCHVAWTNDSIAPSSVAKASLGNGLLYAYTKPKLKPVLRNVLDAWYFTAIDIRTGETVWSRLTGTGIQWNNHYAAIYLGPDGTAYIATLAGLVRLRGLVKTVVVSGSASGIGAATTSLLRDQGDRVITVDLHDADVVADLSTAAGRADAVAGVEQLTDVVHGLVPCAGIAGSTGVDSALVVSVNFFGAVALVRGLASRLAAAGGAGVVLLASNSITAMPGWRTSVADLCLAEDEEAARADAREVDSVLVYPATKAALAWWARREGVTDAWIGQGIRLNSVAPGVVATSMTDQLRADPVFGPFVDSYPTAIGRPGQPEEIAALIAFMLSDAGSLMVGSVVYADGGTDAIVNPRAPGVQDV